jgi:lipoprotein-releasing system permease protein
VDSPARRLTGFRHSHTVARLFRTPLNLPFGLFLALRYLKPKRSFLSVISIITLAGVTLGICVLVVVIAVMTGFQVELRRKILGHEPHLTVSGMDGVLSKEEEVRKRLDAEPGLEATSPYVAAPVLLQFKMGALPPGPRKKGRIISDDRGSSVYLPATMRGVYAAEENRLLGGKDDPKATDEKGDLLGAWRFIKKGTYDLDGDKCVMGIELARTLGVDVGDRILVHGPGNLTAVLDELKLAEEKDANAKTLHDIRQMIQPAELEITGLFDTGHFQFDQELLLVPLHIAQEIYSLGGDVHGIAVRTKDPFWAEAFKPQLAKKLGRGFTVSSWIDQNRKFFEAIEIERTLLFFIVALVIVVAGFSITNTLITITVQKKRDIGILKALGAAQSRIVRVFLSQGVVVGIIGNACGFGLAALIIRFRDEIQTALAKLTGHEIFPREIYQFNRIPAEIVPADMVVIGGLSFLICVLAAMVPAYFAARLDPVRALREE